MKVDRVKLLQALESVSGGLATQEAVEQSSCFVFKDDGLYTYNDEVACWCPNPVPGVVGAVVAQPLLALLPQLPEAEVTVTTKPGKLLVRGKAKQATITMEQDILLPLDAVEKPGHWQDIDPTFADAVSVVQHCAGTDVNNFHLTCVHITPDWVEACDNFQMARYPVRTGLAEPCLVRRTSLKHVSGLGCNKISETESWLHWGAASGVVLSVRREVADYPDLTAYLKKEGVPVVLPGGIGDAVARAEVFAGHSGTDAQVLVQLRDGELRLTGTGTQGCYEERKKIKYSGPDMSFLIAPKLLTDVSTRTTDCRLSQGKLLVDGGAYTYVTCLGVV